MSAAIAPAGPLRHPFILRLALAGVAVAVAAGFVGLIAWLIAPADAAPPARSPFGIGLREAAPSATGLGGWLLALQSSFSRSLDAAVQAVGSGGGWQTLAVIGFMYGVFHAAGPGHGKAVIAGYIVAGERTLVRGFALSLAAALLQAAIPIVMVGLGWYALNATAAAMSRTGSVIETVSFALVALVGAAMTWRKAGRLATLVGNGSAATACGPGCDHAGLTDAAVIDRLGTWRERAGVVLAAGSRPCFGAITILTLAASQGLFVAGIAATLAMALGTALTTGVLASLAVFAKGLALRLAGGRGTNTAVAIGGLEILAAAFVLVLGLAMLGGLALGVAA